MRAFVWPYKDYIENYIDAQLYEINEAAEVQDAWETAYPEPNEDEGERQNRLFEVDIEKRLTELQPRSIVMTYKSTRTLERLTRVLILLTVVLGVLAVLTIAILLHA